MQTTQTSNSSSTTAEAPSLDLITGLFRARQDAEKALHELEKRGYRREQVNVLMSDETRRHFAEEAQLAPSMAEKAAEGAGVGSAVGGVAGAIIASLVALAAPIVLPGVGLVVSGPLVAVLAGAGVGGLAGGILGSLVGLGIPESHAKIYDLGLREGGVLIAVQPRTAADAKAIADDWNKLHAEYIRA